jgi:DNA-binding IclR family transcriptional regulator
MKLKKDGVILSRFLRLKMVADETGHAVSWSVLRCGERMILCAAAPGKRGTLLKKRVKHEPPYRHAAGWVLLAGLSPKMQHTAYKRWGVPGEYYPEICDEADFRDVLAAIRKNNGLIKPANDRIEMAVPVFREKRIVAVISLTLPKDKTSAEKTQDVFSRLQKFAGQIYSGTDQIKTSRMASR